MKVISATATIDELGPLMHRVYGFVEAQMSVLATGVSELSDWEPLTQFIDVATFKRVGAYLEELNWTEYKKFLTNWAIGGTRFEFTELQISEIGNTVIQEIEERHWRGTDFIRKNVVAIYRFNDQRKLVHLDIYEQAKDSGKWIIKAANLAAGQA